MQIKSLENLKDKKVLKAIEQEVADLDNYGRSAGDISGKLETLHSLKKLFGREKDIKGISADLGNKYWNLKLKLSIYLMDLLSAEEILELFEDNLLDIIKIDPDYQETLRAFLVTMHHTESDKFLESVKTALEGSRQEIGDYILLGTKKSKVKGYIKNWIKDYKNYLGAGWHFKMDISKYLFKSENAKRLSADEKNILKEVFYFYERIKLKHDEPYALNALPMSAYGIEVVGEAGSIKAKFKPKGAEEIPEEELPQEPAAAAGKEEEVTGEAGVVSEEALQQLAAKPEAAKTAGQAFEDKLKGRMKPPAEEAAPVKPKAVSFTLESIDSMKKITPDIFRKISGDPSHAAEKIKSEAARLTQKSPLEARNLKDNWQMSELYQLYLDIAREGLNSGMPVDKVIDARTKMGKPNLTKAEFEAVVEISKVL